MVDGLDQTMVVSGWVCARCRNRTAERVEVCPRCWESGVCVPDYRRRTDLIMPRGGRKISAKDLAAQDQQVFCLKAYPSIKTPSNAFIVVHGGEGSGKTSDCLRIAEGYQPSAYAASEMKIGPSLAGYLRRLEIRAENLQIFDPATTDEIVEMASSGIRCLVLDSLSVLSLLPDDCTALAQGNDIIVIGILQHNKRGDAAGSNAWLHAADVVIECDSMRWVLRKSRYQAIDGIAGEVL